MIKICVVGLGYWGPNLLRTFNSLGVLVGAFDKDQNKLNKFSKDPMYSKVYFDKEWTKCLGRADIDGVVVATPPNTHYDIAMKSLNNGKHVFIEKPMTLDIVQAEALVNCAYNNDLIIMVGHIFLYSPEIIKLKEIVNSSDFGDVLYFYTKRLNLGKIQSPSTVIDDLASHDISIINYILDSTCSEVQAVGEAHIIDTIDVAFINLKYSNGVTGNFHLSWLDPLKVRDTVFVGTKQMVVCDSMNKTIKLYNKSANYNNIEEASSASYATHLLTYNYGDVIMPYIEAREPMLAECKDFIKCIEEGANPTASGEIGVEVVRTLEAMNKSIKNNGAWVKV